MPEAKPCARCGASLSDCVDQIVRRWDLRCCWQCTHTTAEIRKPFSEAWLRSLRKS